MAKTSIPVSRHAPGGPPLERGSLTRPKFQHAAWGVLGFDVLVILWGAFVRATHSGAVCGSHWPTCNGEVIPFASRVESLIEFTHRATSGLAFLLAVFLLGRLRRVVFVLGSLRAQGGWFRAGDRDLGVGDGVGEARAGIVTREGEDGGLREPGNAS